MCIRDSLQAQLTADQVAGLAAARAGGQDGVARLHKVEVRADMPLSLIHILPVIQIMVQIHRQKQIAQPLRAAQADTCLLYTSRCV